MHDRLFRPELGLGEKLRPDDLVIGEVLKTLTAQQDLRIARGTIDQLAVGWIDPGHQIALETAEPPHDQRRMHVEQELQRQVIKEGKVARQSEALIQSGEAEAQAAAAGIDLEHMQRARNAAAEVQRVSAEIEA